MRGAQWSLGWKFMLHPGVRCDSDSMSGSPTELCNELDHMHLIRPLHAPGHP